MTNVNNLVFEFAPKSAPHNLDASECFEATATDPKTSGALTVTVMSDGEFLMALRSTHPNLRDARRTAFLKRLYEKELRDNYTFLRSRFTVMIAGANPTQQAGVDYYCRVTQTTVDTLLQT